MKKELLFSLGSTSRDEFRLWGYRFGSGKKTLGVVSGMRGHEIQALHTSSHLVAWLHENEELLRPGSEILVIPAVNTHSFNMAKRFWGLDNTDINRMFPGSESGETTQRVAKAVMDAVSGFEWGINLTSINHPGKYLPHVRIHKTGWENLEGARAFGLEHVHLHDPNAQETGSLNYNWQLWNTKAYSLISGKAFELDTAQAEDQLKAVLKFLHFTGLFPENASKEEVSSPQVPEAAYSGSPRVHVWSDAEFLRILVHKAGLFTPFKGLGRPVRQGELLGIVTDALDGSLLEEVRSPQEGRIFYFSSNPLVYENMVAFTLVPV